MDDKVLIVSHIFPPSPGVGGRRWAKFSKYIVNNGIEVFILTSKYSSKVKSLWSTDVHENLKIDYYKNKYPTVLSEVEMGFFSKFMYKLWLIFLKVFSKGNYYDRAVFLKSHFIKKTLKVIKTNDIKNLIVSGAPFNLLYYGALLKKSYPELNFIADIRDPWTWGQNYGINSIGNKRKKIEQSKEAFVMDIADTVFVPTEIMKEHLNVIYPSFSKKIEVLPHGFDPETITTRTTQLDNRSTPINIAFLGELYDNIGSYFEEIAVGLKKETSPFKLDIFSKSKRYNEIFERHAVLNSKVNYYSLINSIELFGKLEDYHFILIVHPDYAKDYVSTKFHEILYAKIPIIFISNNGLAKNFLTQTNAGICIEKENISSFFSSHNEINNFTYSSKYESDKFDLNKIVEQIVKKLKTE